MMQVIKRNGRKESVKFDKVLNRIKKQTYDLNRDFVDPTQVSQKVINGIYDGVTTRELDELASETAASMVATHSDYSKLASRIAITSLHKEIPKHFSDVAKNLYEYVHEKTGKRAGLISDEVYAVIQEHKDTLDESIIMDRDFNIDYFGFKTLERAYLLRTDGKIAESPQHMFMRVAVGMWASKIKDNPELIQAAIDTYNGMTEQFFTHATPTLFNSGTPRPQMASCFLQHTPDSIEGIFATLTESALISKNAGGIGINVHSIRGAGAYIAGTNGTSNGLVPFLKIFNETARGVDQGGNKRKGSIAVYLEPWHADIMDFLDLRKNHGKEERRARDLFTAMWIPDLFFQRLLEDGDWSLFSPDEAPNLHETVDTDDDKAFTRLYEKYEAEGKARKVVKAKEVWKKIYSSIMETGTPYLLSKDASNKKSNQQNLGTLKQSNLCAEIIEYTSDEETAVCNLASISLSSVVSEKALKRVLRALKKGVAPVQKDLKDTIDWELLKDIAAQLTRNLNQVIDVTYYPSEKAKRSNLRHRPIGIGVQGLADMFAMLKIPFDSEDAKTLNRWVFETIYFGAMEQSMELAKVDGAYETFEGSPLSEGKFQFDLSKDVEIDVQNGFKTTEKTVELSGLWDWDKLREDVMKYGVRNSLLTALMPTASSSQILGNNECFEPFTSNLYIRRTLSGEFVVANKHLVEDLSTMGLWDENVKYDLIEHNGSVQNIDAVPDFLKEVYKTVWEIKQRDLIDMEAGRGHFICQSQSMNLFFEELSFNRFHSSIVYSWLKGNKTLMYYARSKPAKDALKGLGIDRNQNPVEVEVSDEPPTDPEEYRKWMEEQRRKAMDELEDCEMCSA